MSYSRSAGCAARALGAKCTSSTRSPRRTRCRRILLRTPLQGGDTLLDRRVAGEKRRPSRCSADARCDHRLRQRARLQASEATECGYHRLRRAEKPRRACVGAELALAREPHDDHGSENPERDLADEHRDVEARSDAALGAEHGFVHDEAHDARQEIHEGIEYALYEGEGHHVAVGNVSDLMAEHRFDLLAVHRFEQAGRDRDQGRILESARRKGVRRAFVHGDLGHADIRLVGEAPHRSHEPLLMRTLGRLDDVRARRPQRYLLGNEERYELAAETHQQRKPEERLEIEAVLREEPIHAEHARNDREQQHHREVGRDKEEDAFHGFGLRVEKEASGKKWSERGDFKSARMGSGPRLYPQKQKGGRSRLSGRARPVRAGAAFSSWIRPSCLWLWLFSCLRTWRSSCSPFWRASPGSRIARVSPAWRASAPRR